MNWQSLLKDFKNFLKFERNLSDNTIESYGLDILKLINHSKENKLSLKANSIKNSDIREFIFQQSKQLSSNSQSRLISSLKKFFDYLIIEKIINENPVDNIEYPKIGLRIPNTLTTSEIDEIINFLGKSKKKIVQETLQLLRFYIVVD